MKMHVFTIPVVLTLLALVLTAAAAGSGAPLPRPVLQIDDMLPVQDPFTQPSNKLYGIRGDDQPWTLGSVRGVLMSDGTLEVKVRGLVHAHGQGVPPSLVGRNDERFFRVLLTYITPGAHQKVVQEELVSEAFEASPEGDAEIRAQLDLREGFVAPVLFVMKGFEDRWLAVTGMEFRP